ncbi:hypothetical protein TSACC_2670 [Terrimicrobium sacchariphilum]|uniref:NADH:ubiquinone oxidoreductase intermediate-associated protein 30 domain-containing protein n=2 Tax=Terrimicrobium sacchariphilum TaxID=690879 RepID=A0A146G4A7_TERSA|nr:hypothetical protein TSACC_2670 [Terrimicrobium sacchariphilum]
MIARNLLFLCVGAIACSAPAVFGENIEIFSRQNDFLPGWRVSGFGGITARVEDAEGGMVITTTVAPDAADYSGITLRYGGANSSSGGDAIALTGEMKNANVSIELNTPKPPEGTPAPTAAARLQISMLVRLAAGGSRTLQIAGEELIGLTHATLDADTATWETVRVPMQSFLKRLEPSDEAEYIEGIFVQFAPKPNQPFEVGNVTISDAPAQ